ncbi:MAG: biotin--[acetyl-CoA-carboxylase] ligase [Phycisphaerae bacterium]|nr:biotin--[acetyl-CoA-carboxylase] ligase [Phycisphaerae bacterium]
MYSADERKTVNEFDANEMEKGLGTRRVGRCVLCFREVDSTNDVAWDSVRGVEADGLVIFAESQRRGRGRQGRRWLSPPGKNLLFSVLLCDAARVLPPEAVTIAAGLSVAQAIEHETHLHAELKWPNDVRIGGAKAAGVLLERRVENGVVTMVIGIGVNVSAAPPDGEVDSPATCLTDAAGEPVSRQNLAREILRRLDGWVARIAAGEVKELHDAWMEHCEMLHERVTAFSDGREYVGRIVDISPLLGLEIIDDQGLRVHLPAANTSLTPR